MAIESSYFQDIKSELKSCTGTQLGTQKEFDNIIVDAQELLHSLGRDKDFKKMKFWNFVQGLENVIQKWHPYPISYQMLKNP